MSIMPFDPRHSVAGVLAKPSHELTYEGTAFLVQGGVLVTCSHVLRGARRDDAQNVLVHFYGTPAAIPAKVLLDHPDHDLAVLKPHDIPEGIVALPLAPSEAARTHPFEAIGYPQKAGFPALYAQGSIYGLIHDLRGHAFLQLTSLEITHGYSGGPVLDQTLNAVVGIVSNGIPRDQLPEDALRNASFAIATETLQFLYPAFQFAPLPPPQVAGWLRPTAPPLHNMIRREVELHEVRKLLQPGVVTTIQGPPCVGKTVLAHQLALDLDPLFPGGVIFQSLGSEFRNPDLCNPILKEWSRFDAAERGRDLNAPVTPAEVRSLFARQQPLLVILDDIWNLEAVQPLRDALPQNACLLVTTRSQRIAHDLHGNIYSLDVLSRKDALELLSSRLPDAEENAVPLLIDLAEGLGRQALAINIACGSLLRLRKSRWPAAIHEMLRQVIEGTGFGEIQLPDEYPDPRVASALFASYQDLKPESQRRFRLLGAFAPDAPFSAEAAAGVWSCSPEEAEDQLTLFVERSLLTQHTDHLWRQHALLRAYCLALLRQAGEEDSARQSHAQTYNHLIEEADGHQEYYRLLDEYPQLKHAFEWAIEQDLNLAIDLISNSGTLQSSFSLTRDSYKWAQDLLFGFKANGIPLGIAIAEFCLGNALARLANLPDEDRNARLCEALAAYNEASKADLSPKDYANIQNNRSIVLKELAALQGQDRRGYLLEALSACDRAIPACDPESNPLDYARIQVNRVSVLIELAESPDEEQRSRLFEALAACDQALRFFLPDTTPLEYAGAQNNRSIILRELAHLSEEGRHAHLLDALTACELAHRFYRSDITPLEYANTQSNRGLILRDLADLPGENYQFRLIEACEAYREALRFIQPNATPFVYAMIQNNLGIALTDLAELPKENRDTRLLEALDAFTEALRFRRPENAPLDYAATQNNRGAVLHNLAKSPDQDYENRLFEALDAYTEALRFRRPDTVPHDYAITQNNRGTVLGDLSLLPGEDRRARLIEAIGAFEQALRFTHSNTAPFDYGITKTNIAMLYMNIANFMEENRKKSYKLAIESTTTALSIFSKFGHVPYIKKTTQQLKWISEQIGASLFLELWQELDLGEIPDGLKDSK